MLGDSVSPFLPPFGVRERDREGEGWSGVVVVGGGGCSNLTDQFSAGGGQFGYHAAVAPLPWLVCSARAHTYGNITMASHQFTV